MDSSLQYRINLFLLGCIPTRLLLGYITDVVYDMEILSKIFAVVLLIMSMGFLLIFTFGWRKTGAETQGRPIWWNSLRPFHGLMYGLAGILLLTQTKIGLITPFNVLILDTIVGLIAFLLYHFT